MRFADSDPLNRSRFPIDEWALVETEFGTDDMGRTETLFTVGNGYLGLRGNVEEGRDGHMHGTFVNGFHETWPIRHAEEAFGFARVGQTIVNAPDTKIIRLYVDDEPLVLTEAELLSYERRLDFRLGALSRSHRVAHPCGQARAHHEPPHDEPHRSAPRRHRLRGRTARRRRGGHDLEPDPQPPGRSRRVPRRCTRGAERRSTRARRSSSTSGCCSRA